MSDFAINVSRVQDECVIEVGGDLDLASAEDVTAVGLIAVSTLDVDRLVLDVTQVGFADSTGLSALIRIRDAASEASCTVTLRGAQLQLVRVLALTGLTDMFTIEPVDDAPDSRGREDRIAG
ncbi:MAG: STAS domain-containing protein [Actinomycetota bacterium]|nr:STAS domain-containing protein [Actinomycetota bacterium]